MAALTEEQVLIRDQARAWVTEQAPVQKFRELRDSGSTLGYTPATWAGMVEMGWTGILVPEAYGGSNLGYLTFGLVLEELGRQLTASPLLASALVGTTALVLGGSAEQKQEWLPKIVNGAAILTLAVDEAPRHRPEQIDLAAQSVGSGYVLSGAKTFVLEGMAATAFIVAARTLDPATDAAKITLFLVPADSVGLTRSPLQTLDSRGYANLVLDKVAVTQSQVLGRLHAGDALLTVTLDRARAGVSAEMLGTAAAAFDMTLEYLKTRVQFGKVIGSFQALGHRAADLFSELELSRSCVEAALQAIDAETADVALLCSLAKCRAGDFLHWMSNQLIQIHGGIGMTDEFDAGLYLKRARALEALFGNQAFHRDRYATLLGF